MFVLLQRYNRKGVGEKKSVISDEIRRFSSEKPQFSGKFGFIARKQKAFMLSAESEMLSAESEVLSAESEVLMAESEVLLAESEMLLAESEVLSAKSEMLSAESEMLTGESEMLLVESEVLLVESEVLSAESEAISATLAQPKKLPNTSNRSPISRKLSPFFASLCLSARKTPPFCRKRFPA